MLYKFTRKDLGIQDSRAIARPYKSKWHCSWDVTAPVQVKREATFSKAVLSESLLSASISMNSSVWARLPVRSIGQKCITNKYRRQVMRNSLLKWKRNASSASGGLIAELEQSDEHLKSHYDAIIIGGGHNGLISAAYMQEAGLDVCVLERRHTIGGAAITEEIIPGFLFSRASYLLSLLRPQVYTDLKLKEHGLKLFLRDPNSYTPIRDCGSKARSLLLGANAASNAEQIAQFSTKDAKAYVKYEESLNDLVSVLDPLLDVGPPHLPTWTDGGFSQWRTNWPSVQTLLKSARKLGNQGADLYELLTAPASTVLNKWFESEPLKATLATDSVIGAMTSPHITGSGYVLLHHVMGELEGVKGAWGYVEGGMGGVSRAIARAARERGVHIFTNKTVSRVDVNNNAVSGVLLEDGTCVTAKIILSNATPKITFMDLLDQSVLPQDFVTDISAFDYTSPVTKINIAVDRLPNFVADPNRNENEPRPHHQTTIHMNSEDMEDIHRGYLDAQAGHYSTRPIIEMTIPSVLDPSVAPPGCHVVQLFTQYTPYTLEGGQEWTESKKDEYCNLVFDHIEEYAPGFKASVVGRDILTPPDLERIFGLTGGNIFHGAMSLNQLYFSRPTADFSHYRTPVGGLYLCGSGAHPGGGVMGAPGRHAALAALNDWRKK